MRCGFSLKEFAAYDTIEGQQILKMYIREKIENKISMLEAGGWAEANIKKHPVIAEYNRNIQREARWLQRQKK